MSISKALSQISKVFYLVEEFPSKAPVDNRLLAIANLSQLSEAQIEKFSYSLTSSNLNDLLLLLPNANSKELELIKGVLERRLTNRLLELFFALYQYHYTNNVVRDCGYKVLEVATSKGFNSVTCSNLTVLLSADGIELLSDSLTKHNSMIAKFLNDNKLIKDSPLTVSILERFFSKCSKEAYLLNEKYALKIIKNCNLMVFLSIVVRYLDVLNEKEYLDSINDYIYKCLGWPYVSEGWEGIDYRLKNKFMFWFFLRQLKNYFTINKKKLNVLIDFYKYFKNIYVGDNNQILVIDFGKFIVVDENQLSDYSYVIKNLSFRRLIEVIDNDGFDYIKLQKEFVPSARDYIVEEKEDSLMVLDYKNIGKLFIKDMLEIELEIVKDLRQSKTILGKKSKKVYRN